MNEEIEKIKNDIETYLMEDMEHQNKTIDYILYNPKTKESQVLASDDVEEGILFGPFTKITTKDYFNVPEWDFNFDEYLFKELQKSYEIGYISDETHHGIWCTIDDLYPEEFDNKNGVLKYIEYCKENNITKEYLDNTLNLDTPNIMKKYFECEIGAIIEYKGYVAEVDDVNYDNPKENLIHIYKNKNDYTNGEEIETISLDSLDLKNNIKEYINNAFIKDKSSLDSEQAYFTFVLGYDLLNEMLKKSSSPENDVSYDFCSMVASDFLMSAEYRNKNHSAYEMLVEWVNANKENINNEYKNFIGVDDKNYNDNLIILEHGYRKNEPIALVEKTVGERKEYIIAFYYKISENELSWAYGYYYGDKANAVKDYNKVINGGTLVNTFERKDDR